MLRKLRSIFIIDAEGPTQSSSSGSPSVTPSAGAAATQEYSTEDSGNKVKIKGGEVSEKFLNVLLEALDRSDLDGFDYMEFKKFLKSLDNVDLDEATKFRTAYATGQTMGASKENLISSAGRYLDVLKQEESRFEQAVHNQRSKVVEEKQSGISALEQQVTEHEKEIARLTQEIEKNRKEVQQRKEEVALAQAKIEQTKSDFEHTYHHLMTELQEDVEKIRKYLS